MSKKNRCPVAARLAVCLVLIGAGAASARAQRVVTVHDFTASVDSQSHASYFDLIRKIFPGAGLSPDHTGIVAQGSVPISQIFGDYKSRVFEGEMTSGLTQSVSVRGAGGERLLLLSEVSGPGVDEAPWRQVTILALFKLRPEPELLDALDMQADRFTFFAEKQPVLAIHPARDAVLVVNHHFNSGDSYLNYSMISVVEDRLKVVFDGTPTLLGDNHCGTNFSEAAHYTVRPASRARYRDILLTITFTKKMDAPECEPRTRGYRRRFRYRLVWRKSERRYVANMARKDNDVSALEDRVIGTKP